MRILSYLTISLRNVHCNINICMYVRILINYVSTQKFMNRYILLVYIQKRTVHIYTHFMYSETWSFFLVGDQIHLTHSIILLYSHKSRHIEFWKIYAYTLYVLFVNMPTMYFGVYIYAFLSFIPLQKWGEKQQNFYKLHLQSRIGGKKCVNLNIQKNMQLFFGKIYLRKYVASEISMCVNFHYFFLYKYIYTLHTHSNMYLEVLHTHTR